ncbi:MAG: AI-2E family transporter [Nocardioides sp.]
MRHSPFYLGFLGGLGALTAYWLGGRLLAIGSVLVLIVVAMFLAAGLNPAVEFFVRRGLRRTIAVLAVITAFLATLALFFMAIVPVIGDQIAAISKNAPGWLTELQDNRLIQRVDDRFDLIDKIQSYLAEGDWASTLFGGVLGLGVAVLSALANTFIVIVLTLYFLASLPATKAALYRLAPASRRARVGQLGDRILASVGSYVSGAFIVAACAGITSLVFLFAVGLGEYAVALAFVVALLDVIPMIGATLGAVVVSAIGLATDPGIGFACLIFYVLYQQLENYVIYPRVMSRAVDLPGALIVIAAVIGATLLGVVGALLAIPTAAALLLLVKEILIPRQDAL